MARALWSQVHEVRLGISGSQPHHRALCSHRPQEERQAPRVSGRSPRKTQVLQGIQKRRAGNTKASLLLPNGQGVSIEQRCCSGRDCGARAEMPELAHSKAAVWLQQPCRGWAGPVYPAENPPGEKGLHTPGWAAVVLPVTETGSQLNSTLGCDQRDMLMFHMVFCILWWFWVQNATQLSC